MNKPVSFYKQATFLALLTWCIYVLPIAAQSQTIGLFLNAPGSFNGYTLFNTLTSRTTYLIDHNGLLVNSWQSDFVIGNSQYLLENGNLLRTAEPGGNNVIAAGGDAGRVEEFDWEGNLFWEFEYNSPQFRAHHDIAPLPNGNVLMIAWERKTVSEAIAAGRNPAQLENNGLWPEHIIEVEPNGASGGNIVWEWHVWDHLIQDFDSTKANFGVIEDHPELIDINFLQSPGADWLHFNAIDYNPELDQILVNSPFFGEFWIIDHSTTIEEAAGHSGGNSGKGGDILYRWGNPQAYRAGFATDKQLFNQHDAQWIDAGLPGAGNILVFNNGAGRPGGNFSSIDEITPPIDSTGNYSSPAGAAYGPNEPTWRYTAPNPSLFFANFISGAQRLPNGNTLICDGPAGRFFEVTETGETVWIYVNPVAASGPLTQGNPIINNANLTFRTTRYAPEYPGLAGQDLTPGDPIEIIPVGIEDVAGEIPAQFALQQNFPNPFNPSTTIKFDVARTGVVTINIYNLLGQKITSIFSEIVNPGSYEIQFEASGLKSGVYFYTLTAGNFHATRKMVVIR